MISRYQIVEGFGIPAFGIPALSLADICFAAELALFMNEHARAVQLNERGLDKILHPGIRNDYPLVFAHFARLVDHEHFRPDIKPYVEKLLSKAAA